MHVWARSGCRALAAPVLLAVAVLGVAACQAPDPSFLARSEQDCHNGDAQACAMLDQLRQQPAEPAVAAAPPRPRSPVQLDVDAILQGMRNARSLALPRLAQPEP